MTSARQLWPDLTFAKYILKRPIDLLWWALACIQTGHGLDFSWRIRGRLLVRRGPGASLSIGQHFTSVSRPIDNSIGVPQPVLLSLAGGAKLTIGHRVGLSGCSISARHSIAIGHSCLIGSGCLVMDNDAHPLPAHKRHLYQGVASAPIHVAENVFLGARSVVCKGVSIGANTVVGTGSIVTKSLAPNLIAAGNPCRPLRPLPTD